MPATTPNAAEAAPRAAANLHLSRCASAGTRGILAAARRYGAGSAADMLAPPAHSTTERPRLSISRGLALQRLPFGCRSVLSPVWALRRWRRRRPRLAALVVVIVGPLWPRGPDHSEAGRLDDLLGEQLAQLGELSEVSLADPGDQHHVV